MVDTSHSISAGSCCPSEWTAPVETRTDSATGAKVPVPITSVRVVFTDNNTDLSFTPSAPGAAGTSATYVIKGPADAKGSPQVTAVSN